MVDVVEQLLRLDGMIEHLDFSGCKVTTAIALVFVSGFRISSYSFGNGGNPSYIQIIEFG